MRFLADMGVSYSVVGMQRMPDEGIFERAIDEKRVILTFDLDFARLVFDARAAFPSVVIYRLADARALHQIERLVAALRVATSALEAGGARHRRRHAHSNPRIADGLAISPPFTRYA